MLALKHARNIAAIAALLLTGGAQAEPPLSLPAIDYIIIDKSDREMRLYSGGGLVHVIEHIQLGDAPLGHKQFEGDKKTPEGRYALDYGNPNSAYHLSLHVSYPNAADRAFAEAQGRSPGGLIFIHGQPNDWPAGRVPGDWTDGCIAVSNAEIESLWDAVADGTPIDIEP